MKLSPNNMVFKFTNHYCNNLLYSVGVGFCNFSLNLQIIIVLKLKKKIETKLKKWHKCLEQNYIFNQKKKASTKINIFPFT